MKARLAAFVFPGLPLVTKDIRIMNVWTNMNCHEKGNILAKSSESNENVIFFSFDHYANIMIETCSPVILSIYLKIIATECFSL